MTNCLVAQTAASAVCGSPGIASSGPQTRRSTLHQNGTNEPRMSMEINDYDKLSGSADRRFCGLRLSRHHEARTANPAVRPTPEFDERTENVYENKR